MLFKSHYISELNLSQNILRKKFVLFDFKSYLCTHISVTKCTCAQMAESVDALVSNTSGAIHPGSIPGLGTKMERSLLLSFFRLYTLVYIHTFIPAYLPTYILSYPPFHENVYSDLFRISLSIFGFSKDNIYLCRRNNLYIITQQTEKIDEEIF